VLSQSRVLLMEELDSYERQYVVTKPQGIISQNVVVFMFTSVRTLNPAW
jgi:hypothetical protein